MDNRFLRLGTMATSFLQSLSRKVVADRRDHN